MDAERPPLSSVDAVREELRRLGYLDSGLDRFVLAGAGTRSVLGASLRVAVRVGLVGGALFGAVLTFAAAGLDRRLPAEPRDLAVLAVYLMLAVGSATGLVALAGGLAAGWATRRLKRSPGPRLSRNIGLAFALAGVAYLVLWWRSHAFGAPPLVQAAALVLGLALSLLLGRFASLAAVAVLSAGGGGGGLPEASLSRHGMLPLLAGSLLLLGGGVATASYLAGRGAQEAPEFAVVPTGLRVRLLAIDGLERRMTEQLLGRGEMPRLAALLQAGAVAPLLAEPEQVPAIVWTTVATGRGPAAHGIRSTGARRLAGMRRPVSLDEGPFGRALGSAADLLRIGRSQPATAALRGAKAFWNVASEKGLAVGVVNWWATWPADPLGGFIVTDRAFFKLEAGGAPDREVFPAEAFPRLRALAGGAAQDRARRIDGFQLAAAAALGAERPTDLQAVYLPGLDITTLQQLGEAAVADLATLEARLEAVRAYYRFVDGLIGDFVDAGRPRDLVMLVGDPGRLPRRGAAAAEGLLVLAGPAAARRRLPAASERDVAPTVLHLLGLPISRELEGRALVEALDPRFQAEHPVRQVASYGRRPPEAAESRFDTEMLEQLRSLGYVQ